MTKKITLPKEARAKREMTLSEVAHAAGIDISTVWRCEKSNTWPRRPSVRRRMQAALGVKVEAAS